MKYVLITPSRNEEKFIQKTLDSMVGQTLLPVRWVIVDDGSTDRTGAIADDYARRFPWIEVVHRSLQQDRSFAGKVHAFNAGFDKVRALDFEVIGNLDSDLSFDADYLAFLMQKFAEDPQLGVAGTPFIENGYDSAKDSFEGENHVAGGCQLFRRTCWEDVGGYVPNRAGGIDWVAVTTARMKGWKTRSFQEKRFNHYRPLGTAQRGVLASLFSYGEKDYYLGNSPIWEIFRFSYRMAKKPLLFGGLAVAAGFFYAALRRTKRAVSPELMCFHRAEQMKKLKAILGARFRLKKVDSFRLETEPKKQP